MSSKPRRPVWILIGAVVVTVVLYAVPYGRYIAYPLLLLSTYAHEMGHGVAAMMVGGSFESLTMAPDGSGVSRLRVPGTRLAQAFTSAGGLLGPAVLGAVVFRLARRTRRARAGLLGFGIASLVALVFVVRGAFAPLMTVGVFGLMVPLGLRASGGVKALGSQLSPALDGYAHHRLGTDVEQLPPVRSPERPSTAVARDLRPPGAHIRKRPHT